MKTHGTAVLQGGIKDGKALFRPRAARSKIIRMASAAASKASPEPIRKSSSALRPATNAAKIFDVRFNGKLLRVAITALRNSCRPWSGVGSKSGKARSEHIPSGLLPTSGHR